jgi:diaminopimelate decarboxylase
MNNSKKINLFPLTAHINNQEHLQIGGCDCVDLAEEYGTPLYIFDETTIRSKCQEFRHEFEKLYSNTLVLYASKAFLNKTIVTILREENIGLDVVSGGELHLAESLSFPHDNIYFHGNNKTSAELEKALNYKIGRIVADNFYELELLNKLAAARNIKQDILLRLTPGIDAHTHKYTTTGVIDSKFGFPIVNGMAEKAVQGAISASNLNPIGLHFHLGSPIFETSPYELAISIVSRFVKDMKDKYNFNIKEFSCGGGFAVQYIRTLPAPPISLYAKAIVETLKKSIQENQFSEPKLVIEPGRAIIARAGVSLYTIGAIKVIPDVRTYVCVDGGMGDNIRPALYEAKYEALVANKANSPENTIVSIAGKYCESGDILIKDISLPPVDSGDLIAIPVSGAYNIPMASNYNIIPRPAIVMVKDGKSQLLRKRETYDDLIKLDLN